MELELAVIIQETDGSHPEGGHYHQDHVDVGEVAQQKARHKNGEDYYYTSHSGGALFLYLAFQAEVADHLSYLHLLQAMDYIASYE